MICQDMSVLGSRDMNSLGFFGGRLLSAYTLPQGTAAFMQERASSRAMPLV